MPASRTRPRLLLRGLLAMSLAAGLGSVGSPGTAAQETPATVVNVTSEDLKYAEDEYSGCGIGEDLWELCVYYQHGVRSFARVVRDSAEEARRDGSLRMATPGADDRILLTYLGHDDGREFPAFADLDNGSVAVRVVTGSPAVVGLRIACAPEEPYGGPVTGISFAGDLPEADGRWQTVDLVQGGEAPWRSGDVVRPLREWQAECSDGVIRGHVLFLDEDGAEVFVDDLRIGGRTVNFWIPPVTRLDGHNRRKTPKPGLGERLRARGLAVRQYVASTDTWSHDDWTYPARPRNLARGRAAVIAAQGGFQTALVGGPLANAVRGPLLVNPARTLSFHTASALRYAVARGRTVYLVGNVRQLSRKVATQVRELGYDVVRVAGPNASVTSAKVARLIDRRRPTAVRTVLLASGSRAASSLSASAAAGASRGVVLLTRGRTVPPAVQRYLDSRRVSLFAVGKQAAAAIPGLAPRRKLYGANPAVTSVRVAERFLPRPDAAVFASPERPVDAALAGAYGGRAGRPLLLVDRDFVPQAVRDFVSERRHGMADSLLVAEDDVVTDETLDDLFHLLRLS